METRAHRSLVQDSVLRDKGDALVVVLETQGADVNTIDGDCALRGLIEPGKKGEDGRLATFPGGERNREIGVSAAMA